MQQKQYQLLDFGSGRKLERFGELVLDRPSPSALDAKRAQPTLWKDADAKYFRKQNQKGSWNPKNGLPESWNIAFGPGVIELHASPVGHVGMFPEQADNWEWIAKQLKRAKRPLRVLNLFAYTGGSTLAAAGAGAEVTHVDAAKSSVARAKRNAALSGMEEKPVRWIVEDVPKFCSRELRRGKKYDAIILDPPSYGHGPKSEEWRIERDLLPLLATCKELLSDGCVFLLATCHSPGIGPAELCAYLSDGIFGSCAKPPAGGTMKLTTQQGRSLPAGVFARWPI